MDLSALFANPQNAEPAFVTVPREEQTALVGQFVAAHLGEQYETCGQLQKGLRDKFGEGISAIMGLYQDFRNDGYARLFQVHSELEDRVEAGGDPQAELEVSVARTALRVMEAERSRLVAEGGSPGPGAEV